VVEGRRQGLFSDVYAFLLTTSWKRLLLGFVAVYLLENTLFALLYLAGGDCIAGARPGSFADAFFFSVQTLSTIGYGELSPNGTWANLVVGVEAFASIVTAALATGIVFAKFARPTARVLWSNVAVVAPRDGRPCLMFRLANARGTEVVSASLRVSALLSYVTAEGERMRRFYDLALERESTPLFMLTWLVIHPIDENSPLYGLSSEDLHADKVRIGVTLTGIDGSLAQTVYAQHDFAPEHIVWGARFVDVLETLPDGRVKVDYSRFHDVVQLDN
jgi:inward rectifier potassium channel